MRRKNKILFIQLPFLENHVDTPAENLRMAAVYLISALERSDQHRYFAPCILGESTDCLDDRHMVELICESAKPDIIAATVYLWNVERTIDLLREVKRRLPSVMILVGGPEVAPDHPFLFKAGVHDVAVSGEGEQVFPAILESLRTQKFCNLAGVAWRKNGRYSWGTAKRPVCELAKMLPFPGFRFNRPDRHGVAYMETSRGCPLKCTFCCYNQKRHGLSFIRADDVIKRAGILMKRGAKEIRFVDPTFNANPDFENIISGLGNLNSAKKIKFFAELRAETVTKVQVDLLVKANFREIEVGVQSRSKSVLNAIKRPTCLRALDNGIRMMSGKGIKLTVDIMCGLPYQDIGDVRKSLRWAFGIRKAYVQFLHTLLIPGTELRSERLRLGLKSQKKPPYRVISTRWLSDERMRLAEQLAWKHAGRSMDSPTERFCGRILPDLYNDQIHFNLSHRLPAIIKGKTSRRAIVISGNNMYGNRKKLAGIIRTAIIQEPHALWQFVLAPFTEEPLDLFDSMIAVIDKHASHFLDSITIHPDGDRRAARRVFVLLRPEVKYSKSWIHAVEECLSERFY